MSHAAGSRDDTIELSDAHLNAVQRRRRLVLQEDANMPFEAFRLPFDQWLDFRFRHHADPASQIDGIWWDIGLAEDTYALYPSRLLPRLRLEGFDQWCEQGVDWVGELVAACHQRGLEAFWSSRICPVDFPQPLRIGGSIPHDDPSRLNPLKAAHPDWVIDCWWPQGLWNLAVPEVRERKVAIFRELLERYELDGIQLDFARHTPCLPPGREWALRDQVTEFVRLVRLMMLDIERCTGVPRLLAVRVGETIEGNHLDGFEVERWVADSLIDILNLGGRTTTIDVEAFRCLTSGRHVQLCASFDGHHTTDGYYFPPIEYLRGVFRNLRLQGVDTISLFNWACAVPSAYDEFELPGVMKCAAHTQATREAGALDTMCGHRMYAVERRGGYPWAQNFLYRNDERPLPCALPAAAAAATVPLYVFDDVRTQQTGSEATLRIVLSRAGPEDRIRVLMNGHDLRETDRTTGYQDAQIYGDRPQPNSGAWQAYQAPPPGQDLLLVEFGVESEWMMPGRNDVAVAMVTPDGRPASGHCQSVVLEKIELCV